MNYKSAHYKNAEFFIESGSIEFSKNETNDLFADKRKIKISCFVCGEDFQLKRNKILKVLDEEKAGILSYPTLGQIKVKCKSYSVKEGRDERGVARFEMEFEEEKKPQFTAIPTPAAKKVLSHAKNISKLGGEQFISRFERKILDLRSKQELLGNINTLFDSVDRVVKQVKGVGQEIYAQALQIQRYKNKIQNLIETPAQLLANLTGVINSVVNIAGNFGGLFIVFKTLSSVLKNLPGHKSSNLLVNKNTQAISRMVRLELVSHIGKKLAEQSSPSQSVHSATAEKVNPVTPEIIDLQNIQQQGQIKRVIEGELEELLNQEENPLIFNELNQVKYQLSELTSDEHSCKTVSAPAGMNALLLAYKYYRDPTAIKNILELNKIENPFQVIDREILVFT
ncbi:MAG: DNA circularization N-terminal domain-containing protein [Oligoflexia bacterium]|nr:DNA circularization N-terminal domain-containing protein [Oligoflexia bacterium]